MISGLFRIVSLKTLRVLSLRSDDQLKIHPFLVLTSFISDVAKGCTSVGKLSPEIVLTMLLVNASIRIPILFSFLDAMRLIYYIAPLFAKH